MVEHPAGVPELRVRPLDQAQKPVWHPSRGAGLLLAPLPGGRRPQKPSATSDYPLATLLVDQTRMSKLRKEGLVPGVTVRKTRPPGSVRDAGQPATLPRQCRSSGRSHPEATLRPSGSQPVGTPKPP